MAAAREPPVSMVFSEEETEYLKAVMTWGGPAPDPVDRRRRRATREALRPPPLQLGTNTRPPVGEFRILVIGAKGVGKTSILTRVRPPTGRLVESALTTSRSSARAASPRPTSRTTPSSSKAAGT